MTILGATSQLLARQSGPLATGIVAVLAALVGHTFSRAGYCDRGRTCLRKGVLFDSEARFSDEFVVFDECSEEVVYRKTAEKLRAI